jgi:tRNA threonylcarbamoyl adenosine modification protein YeaZ
MSASTPLLLIVECSRPRATVGLFAGLQPLAIRQTPADSRTAIHLIPTLQALYRDAGVGPRQTQAVAATYGPGSFTSLRIGLTTAKTIAFACQCPMIGVNALDALLLSATRPAASWPPTTTAAIQGAPIHTDLPLVPAWGEAVQSAYRGLVYCKRIRPRPLNATVDTIAQVREKLIAWKHPGPRAGLREPPAAADPLQWSCYQPDPTQTPWPEPLVTAALWQTLQPTALIEQSRWLTDLAQAVQANEPHGFVILDEANPPLRSLIQTRTSAGPSGSAAVLPRVLDPPTEPIRLQALAELAWATFLQAPSDRLWPRVVQPVYYRPSAAEEALDAKPTKSDHPDAENQ